MNGELLSIIDQLEREKRIDREILIQAVEAALVSASRKTFGHIEDLRIHVDRKTGAIKIFRQDEEITDADFGRIAAQTAKQVIIQKIREAERETIYNEFKGRVGTTASGTVHRLERNNIIVDLGRTEGLLPHRELSPREQYKQGDRIRAYILDVRKTTKGPQVILSRTHPQLVKKLFELEVPEIYEGIVELKAISREAGDRSKIAVLSHDEKVDCVGACVGMKGQRVKNIVRELWGEKIDIVRWDRDIKTYITNALQPARIASMTIDEAAKIAEVIVNEDQLSLAIGKRGQNVRLAAKLTGWKIDIRSSAELISIEKLNHVGPKMRKALAEAGYKTLDDITRSSPEKLTKIKGIGPKTAQKIYQAAKDQTAALGKKLQPKVLKETKQKNQGVPGEPGK